MFAAKMIELDEKLRHLHERIDDGEHEDITALMGELNALTEEYNLEQDAIRYRLKVDLCQYFEHKKLKGYADFFNSSSSFCCGVI